MDDETKAKIAEAVQHIEQLPVLRVRFGGRDAETGYEVCPESVMRSKVIAIVKALLD